MTDQSTLSLPPLTLAGISVRTSNDRPDQIGELWQRFYCENISGKIPSKKSDDVYSLYIEYEGDHTKPYTLLIGHPVEADFTPPIGLVKKVIPTAQYAVVPASGPQPASLIAAWQKIWSMGLSRTYTGDFDLHSVSGAVDIYVAIG